MDVKAERPLGVTVVGAVDVQVVNRPVDVTVVNGVTRPIPVAEQKGSSTCQPKTARFGVTGVFGHIIDGPAEIVSVGQPGRVFFVSAVESRGSQFPQSEKCFRSFRHTEGFPTPPLGSSLTVPEQQFACFVAPTTPSDAPTGQAGRGECRGMQTRLRRADANDDIVCVLGCILWRRDQSGSPGLASSSIRTPEPSPSPAEFSYRVRTV